MSTTITSREMRALELNAEYFGVSQLQFMENAGHNIALEIASKFPKDKTVAIFCGLGGNGGDGFVAARHLSALDFKVTAILAGKAKEISHKAALENWNALQFLKENIIIHEVYDSALIPEITADIVVDALLGTGTKGKLKPPILQLVQKINAMNAFRIAVDVPTGIDSDTGEVLGEAVKANLTITFHRTKQGLEKARDYIGELIVKDIGLPKELENFAGPGDVILVSKPRPKESHKGDFGRLLIIGGSETYSGAPTLVALAALRTGVDLAYVAAPEKTAHAVSSMTPDLITIKLEGKHLNITNLPTLKTYIETVNAVVLGPGLGLHVETKETVKAIIEIAENAGKPLLLDADGLKAFAEFKRKLKTPLVLTPHAGEYTILTGKKLPEVLKEKILEVQKTAAELSAVILLKGPVDIIADEKRFKLNFTGNPGMTVGGTGDVLSGVVGALLAQKTDPFEAATAGAFVNGAAGDFVSEEKGHHMISTDLLEWIPQVLNDPMSHLKVRKTSAKTT
ncbi:MAG: NAD(P)H-hydrate dehydratase [Candidatus Bathyarchaeota archaeon]|jgi:NAD(P)H-hydrate epimerase|nr:NAD(P)H-hydrate dehydratase [Candidatus Bathyarchaeota archaeon A05DMB-5]MDH7557755.1 NAD(P)H-hydrate dehydratase [Candidatus Bathyarchaeota archaeon]